MKQVYKVFALLTLIFFLAPIGTNFCCCNEFQFSAQKVSDLSHQTAAHESESCHHDGKSGSHSHNECEHENASAEVVSSVKVISPSVSFSNSYLIQTSRFLAIERNSSASLPFETGPPGADLHAIPLYLEISILRI